MIRRAAPDPTGDPTSARLANLTARHDQAIALIEDHLRHHSGNKQLTDALLDIRIALNPPRRT